MYRFEVFTENRKHYYFISSDLNPYAVISYNDSYSRKVNLLK